MKTKSHLSAKQRVAKPTSSPAKRRPGTDWSKLHDPRVAAKPTKEHPEADVKHIVRGVVRRSLQPLPTKTGISLRVD